MPSILYAINTSLAQPALHITGTVQTFTAPVSGIYEFELWGSPGGTPWESQLTDTQQRGRGGAGGYTHVTVNIEAGDIYVYVGGNGAQMGEESSDDSNDSDEEVSDDYEGTSHMDVAIPGWNGGGATLTCQTGYHSASGGGATHISYSQNYIESDYFVRLQRTVYNANGTVKTQGDYNYDTTWGKSPNYDKVSNITKITEEDAIKAIVGNKKYVRVNHATTGSISTDKNHRWFLVYADDWNPTGTIAMAGGGGGGAIGRGGMTENGVNRTDEKPFGDNWWINKSSNAANVGGMVYAYTGGTTAGKGKVGPGGSKWVSKSAFDNIPAASNGTSGTAGTGYAQGKGQFSTGGSGSGGGWYGGYSQAYCNGMWTTTDGVKYLKQGNGTSCGTTGLGGTGYVDENLVVTDKEPYGIRPDVWGGNIQQPTKPNAGTAAAEKGGYVRVTLIKRN